MTPKQKKTYTTVAGVVLALAVFAAQQFGWITPTADNDTRTPRPNAPRSSPTVEPGVEKSQAPASKTTSSSPETAIEDGGTLLEQLFRDKRSDVFVRVSGEVKATLPDDTEGSRHQKFILIFANDHTVLVAHNIDLADRAPLRRGDEVIVSGDYEWSDQGGVIHWTHHDPQMRRRGGYIEVDGQRYE